jgi:radical SAM-linked protein
MSHISPIRQRLRITFGKSGPLKYTGNLDIAKIWERVLRRANLPILYTQGFNTRPRIQLASALPLGITSECEILEVALREVIELDEEKLIAGLLAVSPTGLDIYHIEESDINGPALQALVRSSEYRIRFEDGIDPALLRGKVETILNADAILKEKAGRKGRKSVYNIRPLIHDIRIDDDNSLIAHLAAGDHGNLRPDQLLEEMGLADTYHTIHRFKLYINEA